MIGMLRPRATLAGLVWLLLLAHVQAADIASRANYIVSLGGINIASVGVDLTDSGGRYAINLSADVTGLGQLVSSGTASIASAGRATASGLAPERFDLTTRANGETFSVAVGYSGGNATSFTVEPPLLDNYNRVPIERKHLSKVTDALAAFIVRGPALDAKLCDRRLRVFTGVERFDLNMRFRQDDVATSKRTGYQGPVVLCSIGYEPISGHFTDSEMTNYLVGGDKILLWYAPLGETGYFIPYRVLITTGVGDLSMVLTSMTP